MIDKNIPLTELSNGLARVLTQWRDLGGEALECAWSDFHLDELPPELLPTTLVVDIREDMSQNTYRFWGTGMYDIHGYDMTGKTAGDLTPPKFREAVLRGYAEVVAAPRAYATEYKFERYGAFDHLQTALRLPLSDDGRSVNHIIVVIEWTPMGRKIKSLMPADNLL